MRHGIVAHYLPLGPYGEKGIDVWLALEAYELGIHKRFDILESLTKPLPKIYNMTYDKRTITRRFMAKNRTVITSGAS